MNSKLNFQSFSINELLAKLFVIKEQFDRENIIGKGKSYFMSFCKNKVLDNFIYPKQNENNVIDNLALFLLGEKNKFDEILNNNKN